MMATLRRLACRMHIRWLRARHAQMLCAASSLATDPDPDAVLYLALALARAAALSCQIAVLEQRR